MILKNVPTKDDAFAHANPEQVKVHPQTLENEKQGQKHDEKGKKTKKGKLFKGSSHRYMGWNVL